MVIIIAAIIILILLYSVPVYGGASESPIQFKRGTISGKHTVAIVQYAPIVGNIPQNIQMVNSLLETTPPCDLIMLPECGISGYEYSSREAIESTLGQTEHYCAQLARLRNSHVVCGMPLLEDNTLYDSMGVWDRTGKLVTTYNKWNLWPIDKAWGASAGVGPQHIDLDFGRCALAICNDMNTEDWADIATAEGKVLANYTLQNKCDYILFVAAIPRSKNTNPLKQINHWAMRLSPLIGHNVKLLACSMSGDKYQGQSAVMDFVTQKFENLDQSKIAVLTTQM